MTVSELKKSDEFNAFVAYLKGIWLGNGFEFNLRFGKNIKPLPITSLNKAKENYRYKKK